MKQANPCVFVIILNYRSYDDTLQCVATVRAQTYPNIRLLVVDNASEDQSGALLRSALPEEEFLQLSQNLGYAGGNNIAMLHAMKQGASYVLIVNPDVRLASDTVACYVEIIRNEREVGALNSIQLCDDGANIDPRFFYAVLHPLGYSSLRLDENKFPRLFESNVLLGAALMLPIQTLERVGGFDPLFFAYGEEVDLCRRIQLHGLRLLVTADAPVVHLRTTQKAGFDDNVLFLRLKGFLLSKAKDPKASFPVGCFRVFRSLALALVDVGVDEYPFNRYPLRRAHVVRAIAWFVWNLRSVAQHRAGDKKGRMYI